MGQLGLLGRDREVGLLGDLLDRVPHQGGALLVRGEAGIGKSSVLSQGAQEAGQRGMPLLSAAGVQSETHLPFAGLHLLVRPILGGADQLPLPQRAAILTAFGMAETTAPDQFLIGLAALNLLVEAATEAPLLLLIDDAQWLDRATSDVLTFVARRLDAEPIIMLVAIRDGYESPFAEAGLPELNLGPLDEASAGAILDAQAPDLPHALRARLLGEAAGNPLALAELPAALQQLPAGASLPARLPLTARLERTFAARATELPDATRTLLLVAAVDDAGVLGELLAAAALLGGAEITLEAAEPAVLARLIEMDDIALRFRHPLVRSAILQAAGDPERRAAHASLAEVLADQPDRSVWHLAASRIGPDEEVAGQLEAAAARALRRSGSAVAAAALERAARLSEDPSQRASRLLRAIWIEFEVGRHDLVVRLLPSVEPLQLDVRERARLAWLREVFEEGLADDAERVRSLISYAERMQREGDAHLSVQFLRAAAVRCWAGDQLKETRDAVVAAALRLSLPDDHPELIAILALADPVAQAATVIDRLSQLAPDEGRNPEMLRLVGTAATAVGAFDRSGPFLAAAASGLRAQGRLGLLAQALVSESFSAIQTGDWDVAVPAAEEAGRLATETQQPFWAAGARIAEATLAALRGEPEAESLATEAERVTRPMAVTSNLALAHIALGLASLGGGRYDEAYDRLRRLFEPDDPAYHPIVRTWAIGDLAEAAVQAGKRDAAGEAVSELELMAERSPALLLDAGLRYARALLADEDHAEEPFQQALSSGIDGWPFLHARALLAYGMWLRRRRRVAESRTPLRAARDAFDALGATPWGERARGELLASGERSRRRSPEAWDLLTPQELQIAKMTAQGLTNREIGQKLYLSHRTIGSHLYRIFPKLGITSRSELKVVLGGSLVAQAEA